MSFVFVAVWLIANSLLAQCDLKLYGIEATPDGHFIVKNLDPSTGSLSTTFDTEIGIGSITRGSHVVMNNVYYFVDQSNSIFAIDLLAGKLLSQESLLSKTMRFMETSACDSMIYGLNFQSIRGPAFLNAYDPHAKQLTQVTPAGASLDIALDQNSIHTKLNDNYILIAQGVLYNIDIYTGAIVNQFSVAEHKLISYVADPETNLLYGIEILTDGFALKSLDPQTGEVKLIGTNEKKYQAIAKSMHAISDGHYYVNLNRAYYKIDLKDGSIVEELPVHLDIFKNIEFNNSCIRMIQSVDTEDTSCGQQNGTITVTPTNPSANYNYHWESETENFITTEEKSTDLASGTYDLLMVSSDGSCSETAKVQIDQSDELAYEIETKNVGCEGTASGEIKIEVEGGTDNFEYSIDNGESFQASNIFSNLDDGLYHIVIQGNPDCTVNDLATIEETDEFDISIIDTMEITLGEQVMLEPNISNSHPSIELSWTSDLPQANLSCTDCANPIAQPIESTNYYLNILDTNNGCTATDTISFIVRKNNRDVYIPNIFSPNGDEFNDEFTVFGNDVKSIESLAIYDRWGSPILLQENVKPNDPSSIWDGTYRGKALATGNYSYAIQLTYLDGVQKVFMGQVFLAE